MNINRNAARRAAAPLLVVAGLSLLGGCASVAQRHPGDPWEPMNRTVLQFNEALDSALLRPVATVYKDKVPPLIRTGVSNFFGNLGDMWSFVNSALQGKVQDASDNFARVQVNTVWGVFGIFDVASDLNIERHREDFGQTLGRWGVPAGPYVVLPLFGPSTLRDAVAMPVDGRFDLVRQIDPTGTRTALYTLRVVDKRSNLLRVSNVLEEAALDRYSFTRDAYLQRRRAEVRQAPESSEVPPPLPDDVRYDLDLPPAPAAPAGQPAPAPGR